ncbi:MAG: hypothetical protein A2X64_04430 [Ignavibacteria bacterium GWF2_33_9]|nr:MAG: hypothetical protein A2X64_04430 [Ignavibacteria bacterium GWF2_33_9]
MKIRVNIFTKLFLSFLSIILIYSVLIIYYNYNTTKKHYIENFQNELMNLNNSLIDQVHDEIIENDTNSLRNIVEEHYKTTFLRITILDNNGKVLADSKANVDTMENHLHRPEIQEALKNSTGKEIRYSHTINKSMLYVAKSIEFQGKIIGFVRTSYFLDYIDELFGKLIFDLIKIILVITVLALIAVFFITKRITVPIQRLSEAAKEVAKGNLDTNVEVKSRDELSELSRNFNIMSKRLNKLFKEVNDQKEELILLLTSVPEGILVINSKGNIIFANNAFLKIVNKKDIIGKFIQNILPHEELMKLIDKSFGISPKLETIQPTAEINIAKDIYHISFNNLYTQKELIIVFHNITENKRLEKIKKDFIANISHELKTPLTAIKGFIETLEDEMEDEEYLHYIKIVRRNTDRLINIVQDLLLLSELEDESTPNKLLLTKVNMKVILENTKLLFEQKLQEKELTFEITIDGGFPELKIDPYRFEQVFVNLISNSIKYTDKGGIDIHLKNVSEKQVQIIFSDTGIGIPDTDKARIFERFYISEKSRSRKYDGTGIGLSIVKHIIMLHNGTIELDNTYRKGTKFIINMPVIN